MKLSDQGRAIVFPQARSAEVQSYQIAPLAADTIRIRTEFSAISQGTEIWAYVGKRPELRFPTVPGYLSVGRIEAIGENVRNLNIGQRVMANTSRLTDEFPETWMGAHVSHIVTDQVAVVPEGCDPAGAALAGMAAVSLRGIRMLEIGFGDVVAVTGQGLIGQFSAQLARLRGAIVVASDLHPKRLELSSADIKVNVGSEDIGTVLKHLRTDGIDAVIETTGRSALFGDCINWLKVESQLLLQGYYPDPVSFDFHPTHLKRPKVAITCGFDLTETAICLDLMARGKLDGAGLITHRLSIPEAPSVYSALAANDPDYLGVVFDWSHL
jgi:3-hydroxyethyl bacteriochlorophyllide a dehydrogenase